LPFRAFDYIDGMRAAIFHGKGDIRIEDVAPRALKPGEVRVQIAVALTCGTDLKVLKRGYHAKMLTPPSPFGHELAGTICEIADSVGELSSWKIGDRVVVANSAPCGDCFYCRNYQDNLCDDLMFLNGAYAETIAVPARFVKKNMVRLKPETAFEDAALAEPLACVVQGIEDLELEKEQARRTGRSALPARVDDPELKERQTVLVLGAGPIGLMFVALAKHLGCNVSVAGRGANRLHAATRLGADRIFDAGKEGNIVQAVGDACSLRGFDVVIEAIGKPETWEAAVRLVRKGGAVNFFGGCPGGTTVSLDTHTIHYSSLKLVASFHHTPRTFRRALEFIEAGVVRARDFVDGEWPLTKLPELFQQMTAGNRAIKTLVRVRQ
jgi:L-iditol 2-dehydrogenase